MIEIGTLLQERYLIEKQIGAGGMGAVYLAIDKRFDNHVAIKETFYNDEELGEAFEREARLLNALQHQVLPHVTDYFSENSGYFLVMQFIEGEDLSDILKREGAFPAADVIRWTDNLLDALDYLHSQERPIIHRDIKPHNLKLTPRGDIMLLDFGLAKLNSEDTLGATSVFGYSRTYSPLEQIQGTGTDARSDIFALGATVYHLLTGKPPVDALTRAAAIVNGKTDPLLLAGELNPEISPAVASVINSALALNPENRFISAKAMRRALEYAAGKDTKADFIENAAPTAADPIPQVVPIAPAAPGFETAENENFSALEAFVAEAEQNSSGAVPPNINEIGSDSINNGAREIAQKENPAYSPVIVETSPKAAPLIEPKRKTAILAAAAAILIFGIIAAAMYFSGHDNTAGEERTQTPAAETDSNINPDRESAEKPAQGSETVAENETKPPVIVEKEKIATDETEPAGAENSQTAPKPEIEPARTTTAKRKNKVSGSKEKKSAKPDERSTTDAAEVESVFTGRNSSERRRRLEREIPDEMTEEDFEQLRREQRQRRRERRRARRNNEPIPF